MEVYGFSIRAGRQESPGRGVQRQLLLNEESLNYVESPFKSTLL